MWQDISTAPSGRWAKTTIGKHIAETFVREWCHVLLDGKVYWTCKLESGRWNGFSKNDKPTKWHPAPTPPTED